MIAAASDALWNGGAACGSFYQVSCICGTNLGTPQPCIPGSVVVKIVDYCPPPGCRGTIDLSQEAFAMIADPNAGGINIVYQRFPLTYSFSLIVLTDYKMKTGNQFWRKI
ncbi:Expansin/pollen allergen [Macleaya cordata]|uniref:Expansin/pollen allergen n=1 Tax=Macleaya cordata TaxID=56857 RepID=A0A200QDZ2_MACCD|nr:Expansin/pollen allergen [Macleaya cordata]